MATAQKLTPHNFKMILDLRKSRDRETLFLEGEKLIEEALLSKVELTAFFCRADQEPRAKDLLKKFSRSQSLLSIADERMLERLSELETAPGFFALAKRPHKRPPTGNDPPLCLVLDRLQLPQNAGALLRVAEATGVTEVIFCGTGTDPYNSKCIRGSMGSIFRVNVHEAPTLESALRELHKKGIPIFTAEAATETSYRDVPWTSGVALVLGNEGAGIPQFSDIPHIPISIPMKGRVESLNVAVAGAVCLYEALHQRMSSPRLKSA